MLWVAIGPWKTISTNTPWNSFIWHWHTTRSCWSLTWSKISLWGWMINPCSTSWKSIWMMMANMWTLYLRWWQPYRQTLSRKIRADWCSYSWYSWSHPHVHHRLNICCHDQKKENKIRDLHTQEKKIEQTENIDLGSYSILTAMTRIVGSSADKFRGKWIDHYSIFLISHGKRN